MTGQHLQLAFGNGLIAFRLARRDRKTLAITVNTDLSVDAAAPEDATIERILEKVKKRSPWIQKQIRFFTQFQPRTPERFYAAGETHLYLGRQYKLKVIQGLQERVSLHRGCLVVQSLRPRQNSLTRGLVEGWYRERAHIKFRERLLICLDRFPDTGAFEPTSLVVRHMQQRWGSMTPAGKLIINRHLVRASVDAIDYVITHELCHRRHDHHGPEFFRLLDRVMPDWEKRKMKLERQLS
jgi:predicted metal-dependent hydrolase